MADAFKVASLEIGLKINVMKELVGKLFLFIYSISFKFIYFNYS